MGIVIGASYVRHFDAPKQEVFKYYLETKCADPSVKPTRR
jgi:hypothetical protein